MFMVHMQFSYGVHSSYVDQLGVFNAQMQISQGGALLIQRSFKGIHRHFICRSVRVVHFSYVFISFRGVQCLNVDQLGVFTVHMQSSQGCLLFICRSVRGVHCSYVDLLGCSLFIDQIGVFTVHMQSNQGCSLFICVYISQGCPLFICISVLGAHCSYVDKLGVFTVHIKISQGCSRIIYRLVRGGHYSLFICR